jgi:hypothetical protein
MVHTSMYIFLIIALFSTVCNICVLLGAGGRTRFAFLPVAKIIVLPVWNPASNLPPAGCI